MIGTRSPALAVALAAAFAASTATPAPAHAQEETQEQVQQQEAGTHEVVQGNTLWDLADRFYGDPYRWELIWEANRDRVADPHWIYPGQILTIPGLEGEPDRDVMVVRGAPDRVPGTGVGDRTVFYSPSAGGVQGIRVVGLPPTERLAVSPDVFYSTPWLRPEGQESTATGRVLGFTGAEQLRGNLQTAKPFDRLRVEIDGPLPAVGTLLQVFRVTRSIPEVGSVVTPTGLLTVTDVEGQGVVGVVSREFDRLRVGDRVRPAPRFPLVRGMHPLDVEPGPPVATVVAFGEEHELYNIGDAVLLDVGRAGGLAVGDELVAVADHGEGWSGEIEGRVRVVSVQDANASARIVDLKNPVFREGIQLYPFRKMP